MADDALKSILDRDIARVQIKEVAERHVDLVREVVDYGTHLITRCFQRSDREFSEIISLLVFLKQTVGMLDAVHVLMREGAIRPALLQARAQFEASVHMDFLLKEDSDRRARTYYAWNLRQQRTWARRVLDDTPERREYEQQLGEFHIDHASLNPEMGAEASRIDEDVDRMLRLPGFASINATFDAKRGERRYAKHDPPWHAVLGDFPSFLRVCQEVGRAHEYHIFYSLNSQVTHTSSYLHHFKTRDGRISVEPLRDLSETGNLLYQVLCNAFHTYRVALRCYRPHEEPRFNQKYKDEWRERFRSIPKVKVEVKEDRTGYT